MPNDNYLSSSANYQSFPYHFMWYVWKLFEILFEDEEDLYFD